MTLLALISRWTGLNDDQIIAFLDAAPPDFMEFAAMLKAKLNEGISGENLVMLAGIVKTELPNILALKFDGRRHPSDAAG